MGLLFLISKGARFIYVMLAFEIIILGGLIYNMNSMRGSEYIISLTFSVGSSAISLAMVVRLLMSYGNDYVKF